MEKTTGIVLYQDHICDDIFSLTLGCGTIARACVPGQFVSLFCADASRLLPRPISICDRNKEDGTIRLVYRRAGAGTLEFSRLNSGDTLELMGPLGNGYPMEKLHSAGGAAAQTDGASLNVEQKSDEYDGDGSIWLMGGGIGIPPMLLLARELTGLGERMDVILGYRDVLFLKREFESIPKLQLYIATEDGSFGTKGNVLDALPEGKPKAICACGPTPMLKAIRSYAMERDVPCYLSLEQRMACGVGACLACVCGSARIDAHSQVKNKRICAEGPVFEAREIVL